MGLEDFQKRWDHKSWKELELLEPKRSAPSPSSPSTKAKVQTTPGKDAKATLSSPARPGVPAPVTPPEALEAWRRQRQEGAHPASPAPAKEEVVKQETPKEEPKSEEPDSSDSSSSGFDESEESEDAAVEPQAKPKMSKRQMEFNLFGYKRRSGGRKKRQTKENKEQRLARLARQSKAKGKKFAFASSLLLSSLR